jgi:hypothetical protein
MNFNLLTESGIAKHPGRINRLVDKDKYYQLALPCRGDPNFRE